MLYQVNSVPGLLDRCPWRFRKEQSVCRDIHLLFPLPSGRVRGEAIPVCASMSLELHITLITHHKKGNYVFQNGMSRKQEHI
jgi:hypothetical protein